MTCVTFRRALGRVAQENSHLIVQARRNGGAERDLSSPLSRVNLRKVPLAYRACYSRQNGGGRKQTMDEFLPKQTEGMEKARVSHRSDL